MANELARLLEQTLTKEFPCLCAVTETEASGESARAGAWTKKEELGHLIDSATNNHVRFVRASLENGFEGHGYAQDDWVRLHAYKDLSWMMLVDLWRQYNRLLVHLVDQIPQERLGNLCTISSSGPVTLEFVIDDYVLHMQHHLDHILSRETITRYPRLV